jgi:hypothetical protein
MKVSSLSELKKELHELPQKQLMELCLSLAKYKKDKQSFVTAIKQEIDEHFAELKFQTNLYFVKKSLRKLLRILTKYCKYMGDKASATDVHIYFCVKLKASNIPYHKSQLLINMYEQQLKKINTLILGLHEDLQQDYFNELQQIL